MGFSCVGDFNYFFIAMQISLSLICQLKAGTTLNKPESKPSDKNCFAAAGHCAKVSQERPRAQARLREAPSQGVVFRVKLHRRRVP